MEKWAKRVLHPLVTDVIEIGDELRVGDGATSSTFLFSGVWLNHRSGPGLGLLVRFVSIGKIIVNQLHPRPVTTIFPSTTSKFASMPLQIRSIFS